MVKIMHIADVHLDSPFSMRSPSQAERCKTELRGAFTSAIMFARAQNIGIVLISGDLFDSEYVTPDTKDLLVEAFASAPECRFFICPGNHDPLTASSVYKTTQFPSNVHIFGESAEKVEIPEENVAIYGRAYTSRRLLSSPLADFHDIDKRRINILVCHGDVDMPLSEYGPIGKKEIAASGFDYIALGHVHKGSGLQKEGTTYWCYPGCLQGRGFDETGAKGVMVGFVDKGNCDLRLLEVARRRFEERSVELNAGLDKYAAIDYIKQQLKDLPAETELRLTLTGEIADGVLINASDIGSCTLIDRTEPKTDYTALEKSGTLKGVFYTKMKAKLDELTPGTKEYDTVLQALKIGLAALADRNIEIPGVEEQ